MSLFKNLWDGAARLGGTLASRIRLAVGPVSEERIFEEFRKRAAYPEGASLGLEPVLSGIALNASISEDLERIVQARPDIVFGKAVFLSYGDRHLEPILRKYFKFLVTIPLESHKDEWDRDGRDVALPETAHAARLVLSTPLGDPRMDWENCDIALAFQACFFGNEPLRGQAASILARRLAARVDVFIADRRIRHIGHETDCGLEALCLIENDELPGFAVRSAIESTVYKPASSPIRKRKFYFTESEVVKCYQTINGRSSAYDRELSALLATQDLDFVPRLHDWGCRGRQSFIKLQRIHGGRLIRAIERLRRTGEFDPRRMLRDYLRMSLAIVERAGWHNDLYAHNMVLSPDGRLYLFDFESISPTPQRCPFGLFLRFVVLMLGKKPPSGRKFKDRAEMLDIAMLKGIMPPVDDQIILEIVEAVDSSGDWVGFAKTQIGVLDAALSGS